jgi:hypothetical protein
MFGSTPDRFVRNVPSLEPFGMLLLFGVLNALPVIATIRLLEPGLLEPGLVSPVVSILLFAQAAIAAVVAHAIRVRATSAELNLWDYAGAFTLMGCAAAILGEPDQAALFFEEQAALRPNSQQ